VITTAAIAPDQPVGDLCGSCTACLEACPTGAIVSPQVVDARRCISYQTIENRAEIPAVVQREMGQWVFGCDICQEVCPWNRFARTSTESDVLPRPGHANPDLDELLQQDAGAFEAQFRGTPLMRAKHAGIQRNARIATRNG
jgi:epoxyqueuosine reductase